MVVAVAVELDRQPLLGPAAVDPAAARRSVGHGEWQIGRAQAVEEPALDLLRVTCTSPRRTARSRPAPGAFGRRARTASTCFGVVRWRTPASWQARARSATSTTAARSTRVRAGVVTGMPRQVVVSLLARRARRVLTPSRAGPLGQSPRAAVLGPPTGPTDAPRPGRSAPPPDDRRAPPRGNAPRRWVPCGPRGRRRDAPQSVCPGSFAAGSAPASHRRSAAPRESQRRAPGPPSVPPSGPPPDSAPWGGRLRS